ncbi:hypothetical protein [Micromonospora sp. ALFpr18c]|uniref:hypothetical protein n=1 Tax=Micromonospora sp. ALFpr18c TaxID=1458665 RepID=UPI001CEC7991|nr:hypothetical protein [Micromonospora sp. ALFpr18c]
MSIEMRGALIFHQGCASYDSGAFDDADSSFTAWANIVLNNGFRGLVGQVYAAAQQGNPPSVRAYQIYSELAREQAAASISSYVRVDASSAGPGRYSGQQSQQQTARRQR